MKLIILTLSLIFFVVTKSQSSTDGPTTVPDDEGVTMAVEDQEGEETIEMKPVEYCSTSELMIDGESIDYRWKLSNVLTYMSRMGSSNYEGMQLQLNVSQLKFHEDVLHGNWSFSIYKKPHEELTIKMMYITCKADHLTINGEVLIKLPCGKVLTPQLIRHETRQCEHNNGYNYNSNNSWSGHYWNQNNKNKTIFFLEWTLPNDEVKNLFHRRENKVQEIHENSNNSTTMNDVDLLFHIDAIRTESKLIKVNQDCGMDTVQSLKSKNKPKMEAYGMMNLNSRGVKSRQSYSTAGYID